MATCGDPGATRYEVVVAGGFGPPYLATFASLGVERAVTSSAFRLRVSPDREIDDVVDTLQVRGHVILEVRTLGEADLDEAG